MKNVETEPPSQVQEQQILKDIFSIPEVVRRGKLFEKKFLSKSEGNALVFKNAEELLIQAGHREKDNGDLHFNDSHMTDSIRVVVDGEPVYLHLHSTLDKREYDVLANIINLNKGTLPILFSAISTDDKIKVENGNMKQLENDELGKALGVLSIMKEALPYEQRRLLLNH
jgi:hypothetical protein